MVKQLKIALIGYGKMGKTIEKLALDKGHAIVYKSTSNSEEGNLNDADVAIEFSNPEAAFHNISKVLNLDIPVVSGTTGWLKDYDKIEKLCQSRNGSFVYASNFSVGVNLFSNILEYASKLMANWNEYDIEITEIHHTEKKDAPSGTAISLAEIVLKHSPKTGWELDGENAEKLKITAKREHDVKGTHEVDYSSEIDIISLKHEAHSREGFAKGAIFAAEWLVGKKGVFSMKEVLGLES